MAVKPVKIGEAFEELVASLEARKKMLERGDLRLARWGYSRLDEMTGGILPNGFTILRGKPGHGKSTLAANVAVYNAIIGADVVIWSSEMTPHDVAALVASILLEEKRSVWRDARYTRKHIEEARAALQEINDRITIINPDTIDEAFEFVEQKRPSLLIVDYMQNIARRIAGMGDIVEKIGEISHRFSLLVRHGVGVLALAATSSNNDKVFYSMFVNYDAAVDIIVESGDAIEEAGGHSGVTMTVKIVKNRFGPTGTVELFFDRSTGIVHDVTVVPLTEIVDGQS